MHMDINKYIDADEFVDIMLNKLWWLNYYAIKNIDNMECFEFYELNSITYNIIKNINLIDTRSYMSRTKGQIQILSKEFAPRVGAISEEALKLSIPQHHSAQSARVQVARVSIQPQAFQLHAHHVNRKHPRCTLPK